jgi:hypothetical protein
MKPLFIVLIFAAFTTGCASFLGVEEIAIEARVVGYGDSTFGMHSIAGPIHPESVTYHVELEVLKPQNFPNSKVFIFSFSPFPEEHLLRKEGARLAILIMRTHPDTQSLYISDVEQIREIVEVAEHP